MQAWRTERNVRTVNAQGALSLIRCKPFELKELTCEPYERCSRFVTAFTVRVGTDRKSKMRTESVRVYWTLSGSGLHLTKQGNELLYKNFASCLVAKEANNH